MIEQATLEQVESVLLSKSFKDYVKAAWPHIEPAPMVWNWHMDVVCEHLEAVSRGQIEKLVINIPPGCSKSLVTSVFWPTWEWTWRPQGRWFYATYDQQLSTRDSVKCRRLIESRWYQDRWGHVFKLTGDQNLKMYFENDKKGYRLASTPGGHGTGEHPDRKVVDDALSAQQAESEAERKNVQDWHDQTMSTRGVALDARSVVQGQRLHQEDLPGHVLKEGDWEHLKIPMRFNPRKVKTTCLGWKDPRTEPGELLTPQLFDEKKTRGIEKALGTYGTAGQLQQEPAPAEGGIFKRHVWRFWQPKGMDLGSFRDKNGNEFYPVEKPDTFDEQLLSIDCSFKEVTDSIRKGKLPDPVSCGAWARKGPDCYLLDRLNKRMDVVETAQTLYDFARKFPLATKKLVEDKANGPAVIQLLRHKLPGLIPVTPQGSKQARVTTSARSDDEKDARTLSCQGLVEAGNVFLPHPAIAPWVWDFIEHFANFPNGAEDDDIDMTSQALARLQLGTWKHQAEADKEAERAAKAPKTLEELRARQWDETMFGPKKDESIPERYKYLNGR